MPILNPNPPSFIPTNQYTSSDMTGLTKTILVISYG
jgi:hypothetical protein